MVPRLSLPAITRFPSTVCIRKDSHLPCISETSIFFSETNRSINLLLPIVPTITEEDRIDVVEITLADSPDTLHTSSPRSLAARTTPFQSEGSTHILAAVPLPAILKEPSDLVCWIYEGIPNPNPSTIELAFIDILDSATIKHTKNFCLFLITHFYYYIFFIMI